MPRRAQSKNSLRNMKQYKDMTDEEFNKLYAEVVYGQSRDEIIEERFNRLMLEFEDEYDLSELLPNDRVILRNLINSMLQLEDFEIQIRSLSLDSQLIVNNIVSIDRLSNVCDKLRSGISSMQGDLGITRKLRKNDKEQSVITFLDELKKKADQFAHQKMRWVFCEKCGLLLATVWFINPESTKEKITVHCTRILEDGDPCNFIKTFTANDLISGSNKLETMPETLR